jgi:hypothetical protein
MESTSTGSATVDDAANSCSAQAVGELEDALGMLVTVVDAGERRVASSSASRTY